jgi:hypothetical protein
VVGARLAGTLITAALLALGCGGDDAGGDGLSKEEYTAEAEAALDSFGALAELKPPTANAEAIDSYLAEVRGIFETALDDLRALEPPEDVVAIHRNLVTAIEAYSEAFPPVADAATANDEAALQQAATDLQAAAFEFQETATDLDQRFEDEGIDLQSLAG